jgi:hypothetical protein
MEEAGADTAVLVRSTRDSRLQLDHVKVTDLDDAQVTVIADENFAFRDVVSISSETSTASPICAMQ